MRQKRVFVHWSKYDSRSASLAYHLGADAFFIQSLDGYSKLIAPAKYVLNTFITFHRLWRAGPDAILVANPPIFAVLVVWAYSFLRPCCFIVDTHSATFTVRRWSVFLWLYRLLSKRALLNILHNEVLEHKVASWGVPSVDFGELLYNIEADKHHFPFREGFNVVFVSLFSGDEPLEEVLDAARKMSGVNFYVTGSLAAAPKGMVQAASDNIIFTDYLPDEKYGALLRDCDVVICLTTKNHTMQNGAYEALVLGRPIITSDWPVLRRFYYKGTVCIDNSSESLVRAILRIKEEYPRYLQEINELHAEFIATWQKKFSALLGLLDRQQEKK